MSLSPIKLPDAHTDPEALEVANDRLIEAFLASPEGLQSPVLQEADCDVGQIEASVWTLLDLPIRYLDAYPATLDATQIETLMLEICPRVLLLPLSDTPRRLLLVWEQFWRFLDRVFKQPHAPAVLEKLSQIGDTFEQRMTLPRSAERLGARPATVSPFMDLTEPFDLHALAEGEDDLDEDLWERYRDGLVHHFRASPEGLPLLGSDLQYESWLYFYLDYGQRYHGVPADLNRSDTEMLLTEDLPYKITPDKDSRPEDAIPALIAFWRYLGRVHQHPEAQEVIDYLHSEGLGKQFREAIFDPGRGGIAKNFFMAGQQAGYDMTDPQQVQIFQALFNEAMHSGEPLPGRTVLLTDLGADDSEPGRGPTDPRKKRKRKAAKAARKANKSKKKKK